MLRTGLRGFIVIWFLVFFAFCGYAEKGLPGAGCGGYAGRPAQEALKGKVFSNAARGHAAMRLKRVKQPSVLDFMAPFVVS